MTQAKSGRQSWLRRRESDLKGLVFHEEKRGPKALALRNINDNNIREN